MKDAALPDPNDSVWDLDLEKYVDVWIVQTTRSETFEGFKIFQQNGREIRKWQRFSPKMTRVLAE